MKGEVNKTKGKKREGSGGGEKIKTERKKKEKRAGVKNLDIHKEVLCWD